MTRMLRLAALALFLAAGTAGARAQQATDDPMAVPLEALARTAPTEHPLNLFILAIRKFEAGERDEAVQWLYVAQIRTRFRLSVVPDLDPSGEPALFSSFMEVIGRPINEWAAGDVDAWTAGMQSALDWDAANDNAFTSKTEHAVELETVRAGLAGLIASTRAQRDEIRATREENGLENRTP